MSTHQMPKSGRERLLSLRPRLKARAEILRLIRRFFDERGFWEVETPLRVAAPAPELHIDPIPSGNRFLITSPELQMKRLLQAGYERIYQICHCFRDGERGRNHLPEFTMLEWYRGDAGMDALMADCEALLSWVARGMACYPVFEFAGVTVDLTPPYERLEVADAFERLAGWRPDASPDPDRFDRDLVSRVEPGLPPERPLFLCGYPAAMASLARLDPANEGRAERFEMYAGGLELANGFSELTDAAEQRRRFEQEAAARGAQGKVVAPLDEPFLEALSLGLPPCAGIALGVDRLVMLLTGAETIDDVVAFPEGV